MAETYKPSQDLSQQLQELESYVNAWHHSNKQEREKGEAFIYQQLDKNPDNFFLGLCAVVPKCQHEHIRSLISILIRTKLATSDEDHNDASKFLKLNKNTQNTIKQTLLQWAVNENNKPIRNQVFDTITELAVNVAGQDPWIEIVPWSFQLWQKTNDENIKQNILQVLGYVCEQAFEQVEKNFQNILQLYANALSKGTLATQVSTMEAISLTIHSLESDKCKMFEDVVTQGLPCLENCIKHDLAKYSDFKSKNPNLEPDMADIVELSTTIIQVLADIAEHEPLLFSKSLDEYVNAISMIVMKNDFPDILRTTALSILINLAKSDAAMCRKKQSFAKTVVKILFESFLLEWESDEEWNEQKYGEHNPNTLESHGVWALDEFLKNLDVSILLPLIIKQLDDSYWKSTYPNRRNCALNAIIYISEYLDDEQLVLQWVDRASGYAFDANPRIRYAAINVIGQCAQDHKDLLTNSELAPKICDIFVKVLQSQQKTQVHCAAAYCLSIFVDNRQIDDVLMDYLDDLLKSIFNLLSNSPDELTELLLDAIASLAEHSQDKFTQYYDNFVPKLMNVIKNTKVENLRCQAIECMSFIGRAVGAQRFEKEALLLMPYTLDYFKNSNISGDEKMFQTILVSWPRICQAIGFKFLPYLDDVMNIIIKAAQIDFKMQSLDNYKQKQAAKLKSHGFQEHGNHTLENEVERIVNNKITPINDAETNERLCYVDLSLVETKTTALAVMRRLCKTLKHLFWKYIPKIWPFMVEACKDKINSSIRFEGVNAMPDILQATVDSIQFSQTLNGFGGNDNNSPNKPDNDNSKATEKDLINLTHESLKLLVDILAEGRQSGFINETCKAVDAIFELVPQNIMAKALQNNEIEILNDILSKAFRAIDNIHRYVETMVETKKNRTNWDEIDESFLMEEKVLEEQSLSNLASLISRFIKQFGDKFIPLFEKNTQIMETMIRMLDMPQDSEDTASLTHKTGTYLCCDLYESCSAQYTIKYIDIFLPRLGKVLEIDSDFSVGHPAFYALGIIVEKCKNGALKYIDNIIKVCYAKIKQHSEYYKNISNVDHTSDDYNGPDVNEDLLGMVDNAISCLLKIYQNVDFDELNKNRNDENKINKNEILAVWFDHLPIKLDTIEAFSSHAFLLNLIKNKHPVIMNGGKNIPKIVSIFVDIYDTELCSASMDDMITSFIKTLLQNQDAANAVRQYLPEWKWKKLQNVFFSQQGQQ